MKTDFCKLVLVLFLLATVLCPLIPVAAKSMRPPPDSTTEILPGQSVSPALADVKQAVLSEEWQFFRINAQYRGTVKKSFSNLGCAIAWFKDLTPDQTQVIVHVCALHPEKKNQKFAFRLNLVLRRESAKYSLISTIYSGFSGITGDRQNQLQQLVSLWSYMRRFAYDGILFNNFDSCGAALKLAEAARKKGRVQEINCSWPGRRSFSGKFFFDQVVGSAVTSAFELDKLRFRSGKLSVSLVKDSQAAVTRDFAYRQPFTTDVFK